ncbi:IclR family transcriptional regulator [Microvirga sp. G4-2]|uniref:IclR family transcriptional regulator n=1 Tax=Microvirga sp. G4-2 TaxID=3434467 RepID=UPI004043A473
MPIARKVPKQATKAAKRAQPASTFTVEQSREKLLREGDRWILSDKDQAPAEPRDLGLVPALDKAIRILSLINDEAVELTLADITERTDVSKSHCHAILKTLVHHQWLEFNEATRSYRLHAGVLRDLSSVLREQSPLTYLRPILQRLSKNISTPCIASQPLTDGSFLVVDKVSGPGLMEISHPIGYRYPRDASAQMKANLAWRPKVEVERWFASWTPKRYSARTIVSATKLRSEIAATRKRGYARSAGEFTDGLMAMALPLFDQQGNVLYILDCIGTIPVMSDKEELIAREMIRAAGEFHGLMGSRVPDNFPHP